MLKVIGPWPFLQIGTIHTIAINWLLANNWNQVASILFSVIKDIACYLLSYRFTSTFVHAKSILTPCQKVCYNYTPKTSILVTYISSLILRQGWHIYIEGVFPILCSPSIIISVPAKNRRVGPGRFWIYSKNKLKNEIEIIGLQADTQIVIDKKPFILLKE